MKTNRRAIRCLDLSRWGGFSVVSKGFTLIELLVVIAIISLLVSILLPSLNRAKDIARKTVCMSNLRGVKIAIMLYGSENENFMPTITEHKSYENLSPYPHSLAKLYPDYLDSQKILQCPGAEKEDEESVTLDDDQKFTVSYLYQDSAQSVSLSREGLRVGQEYSDWSGWMGIPIMSCRTNYADFPFSGTIRRLNHGMNGGIAFGQTSLNFLMLENGQLIVKNMVAEDLNGDGYLDQSDLNPTYFVNVLRGWRGWNYGSGREWQ